MVLLVGVGGSDDVHVRATPVLRAENMSAVASGFGRPVDEFVAFDFVSIHYPYLDYIPA